MICVAGMLAIGVGLGEARAQTPVLKKYFIRFVDKDLVNYKLTEPSKYLSIKSLERRKRYDIAITYRDIPVNPMYLTDLNATGVRVLLASRWYNAALVEADSATMVLARQKAYVLKGEALQITSNGRPKLDVANTCGEAGQAKKEKLATGENYGISLSQNRMLGIDAMHKDGYNAKGVSIAVMDGGFMNADSHTVFAAMHAEGRLKGNYDMVGNGVPNYKDSDHGTEVLS